MDGYKDLISLDVIQYSEKTSANIYKDFGSSSESKIINSLYSQKIIDGDFLTNPKMFNNTEKKLANKKTKTVIYVIGNQAQLTGQERRNGFIAEFKSARPNSEIFEVPTKWNSTEAQEGVEIILYSRSEVKMIANGWNRGTIIFVPETIINDTKKSNPLQVASLNWKNNFTKQKIKFIETLLPLISYQNQKIIVERARLFEIYDYLDLQKTLPKDDIVLLENMAKKYLINSKNKHKIDLVKELLQSVDIIPNSIVLAQAANESGWGSSRFAKEHNALFGQYTYDEKNGVVPLNRDEGEHYLIRYFSSIDKSIESYFKNINTHYAYEKFRQIRSEMNKNNLGLNVKLLTQHLDAYAKDEFYVETINSIIETNNFIQFDLTNQYFVNSL
jgi:Bax protein